MRILTAPHFFRSDRKDCILTPVPQYPLYSATIELYNGTLLPYYLDENKQWALNVDQLRDAVAKAQAEGKTVRGLVVINPGNPTGNILSEENMREIVQFVRDTGVVLFADEVYQDNIYKDGAKFVSFKKVGTLVLPSNRLPSPLLSSPLIPPPHFLQRATWASSTTSR